MRLLLLLAVVNTVASQCDICAERCVPCIGRMEIEPACKPCQECVSCFPLFCTAEVATECSDCEYDVCGIPDGVSPTCTETCSKCSNREYCSPFATAADNFACTSCAGCNDCVNHDGVLYDVAACAPCAACAECVHATCSSSDGKQILQLCEKHCECMYTYSCEDQWCTGWCYPMSHCYPSSAFAILPSGDNDGDSKDRINPFHDNSDFESWREDCSTCSSEDMFTNPECSLCARNFCDSQEAKDCFATCPDCGWPGKPCTGDCTCTDKYANCFPFLEVNCPQCVYCSYCSDIWFNSELQDVFCEGCTECKGCALKDVCKTNYGDQCNRMCKCDSKDCPEWCEICKTMSHCWDGSVSDSSVSDSSYGDFSSRTDCSTCGITEMFHFQECYLCAREHCASEEAKQCYDNCKTCSFGDDCYSGCVDCTAKYGNCFASIENECTECIFCGPCDDFSTEFCRTCENCKECSSTVCSSDIKRSCELTCPACRTPECMGWCSSHCVALGNCWDSSDSSFSSFETDCSQCSSWDHFTKPECYICSREYCSTDEAKSCYDQCADCGPGESCEEACGPCDKYGNCYPTIRQGCPECTLCQFCGDDWKEVEHHKKSFCEGCGECEKCIGDICSQGQKQVCEMVYSRCENHCDWFHNHCFPALSHCWDDDDDKGDDSSKGDFVQFRECSTCKAWDHFYDSECYICTRDYCTSPEANECYSKCGNCGWPENPCAADCTPCDQYANCFSYLENSCGQCALCSFCDTMENNPLKEQYCSGCNGCDACLASVCFSDIKYQCEITCKDCDNDDCPQFCHNYCILGISHCWTQPIVAENCDICPVWVSDEASPGPKRLDFACLPCTANLCHENTAMECFKNCPLCGWDGKECSSECGACLPYQHCYSLLELGGECKKCSFCGQCAKKNKKEDEAWLEPLCDGLSCHEGCSVCSQAECGGEVKRKCEQVCAICETEDETTANCQWCRNICGLVSHCWDDKKDKDAFKGYKGDGDCKTCGECRDSCFDQWSGESCNTCTPCIHCVVSLCKSEQSRKCSEQCGRCGIEGFDCSADCANCFDVRACNAMSTSETCATCLGCHYCWEKGTLSSKRGCDVCKDCGECYGGKSDVCLSEVRSNCESQCQKCEEEDDCEYCGLFCSSIAWCFAEDNQGFHETCEDGGDALSECVDECGACATKLATDCTGDVCMSCKPWAHCVVKAYCKTPAAQNCISNCMDCGDLEKDCPAGCENCQIEYFKCLQPEILYLTCEDDLGQSCAEEFRKVATCNDMSPAVFKEFDDYAQSTYDATCREKQHCMLASCISKPYDQKECISYALRALHPKCSAHVSTFVLLAELGEDEAEGEEEKEIEDDLYILRKIVSVCAGCLNRLPVRLIQRSQCIWVQELGEVLLDICEDESIQELIYEETKRQALFNVRKDCHKVVIGNIARLRDLPSFRGQTTEASCRALHQYLNGDKSKKPESCLCAEMLNWHRAREGSTGWTDSVLGPEAGHDFCPDVLENLEAFTDVCRTSQGCAEVIMRDVAAIMTEVDAGSQKRTFKPLQSDSTCRDDNTAIQLKGMTCGEAAETERTCKRISDTCPETCGNCPAEAFTISDAWKPCLKFVDLPKEKNAVCTQCVAAVESRVNTMIGSDVPEWVELGEAIIKYIDQCPEINAARVKHCTSWGADTTCLQPIRDAVQNPLCGQPLQSFLDNDFSYLDDGTLSLYSNSLCDSCVPYLGTVQSIVSLRNTCDAATKIYSKLNGFCAKVAAVKTRLIKAVPTGPCGLSLGLVTNACPGLIPSPGQSDFKIKIEDVTSVCSTTACRNAIKTSNFASCVGDQAEVAFFIEAICVQAPPTGKKNIRGKPAGGEYCAPYIFPDVVVTTTMNPNECSSPCYETCVNGQCTLDCKNSCEAIGCKFYPNARPSSDGTDNRCQFKYTPEWMAGACHWCNYEANKLLLSFLRRSRQSAVAGEGTAVYRRAVKQFNDFRASCTKVGKQYCLSVLDSARDQQTGDLTASGSCGSSVKPCYLSVLAKANLATTLIEKKQLQNRVSLSCLKPASVENIFCGDMIYQLYSGDHNVCLQTFALEGTCDATCAALFGTLFEKYGCCKDSWHKLLISEAAIVGGASLLGNLRTGLSTLASACSASSATDGAKIVPDSGQACEIPRGIATKKLKVALKTSCASWGGSRSSSLLSAVRDDLSQQTGLPIDYFTNMATKCGTPIVGSRGVQTLAGEAEILSVTSDLQAGSDEETSNAADSFDTAVADGTLDISNTNQVFVDTFGSAAEVDISSMKASTTVTDDTLKNASKGVEGKSKTSAPGTLVCLPHDCVILTVFPPS